MDALVFHTGVGWDLAGYGESDSPLCLAVREGNTVTAKVIKYQPVCSPALELVDDLSAAVDEERRLLEECCGLGPFLVDVPIDLQSLCSVVDRRKRHEIRYYWQLVMRPIDFTLNGMKPLADNIGYPVARLANVLSGLGASTRVKLGETLFETYPAASLEILSRSTPPLKFVYDKYRFRKSLMAKRKDKWPAWAKEYVDGLPKGEGAPKQHPVDLLVLALGGAEDNRPGAVNGQLRKQFEGIRATISRSDKPPYKGGVAQWREGAWAHDASVGGAALSDLMNALRLTGGEESFTVTADDFDAVMCALVAVLPECNMGKHELGELVRAKMPQGLAVGCDLVPEGYRVLKEIPREVRISLTVETFTERETVLSCLRLACRRDQAAPTEGAVAQRRSRAEEPPSAIRV